MKREPPLRQDNGRWRFLTRIIGTGQRDAPFRPSRSHFIFLLGGGVFIVGIIVLLSSIAIYQGKKDARTAAETTLANLTDTFTFDINNSVREIDLAITAVLDEVSRQQKSGQRDEQALIAAIAREDARHPNSIGIRILGPDGKLRYGVSNMVNRDVDFSQHEEFKRLRDSPDRGLVVTGPFLGPVAQEWVIGLARRITNPDGSFGGAVFDAIPSRYLTQVFASLDLGPGGSVALYHTSFQLAARFPDSKVGTSTISDQLAAVIASGVQSEGFTNLSPVDNVRRTGIARKIDGLPYYVSVALADDDFMARWQQHRKLMILLSDLWIGIVVLGMLILFRTLSNWQRAMNALTTSEGKLRGLFSLSPVGIVRNTLDGRIVESNESFRAITGYGPDELQTLHSGAMTPGNSKAEKSRQIESLRSTGRCGPYEKEFVRKDGSLVPLSLRSMLVTEQDGSQCIWSLVEDITERKKAEEQLRVAAITFESQEGMAVTDANGIILRVNQAYTEITCYAAEEAVGRKSGLLKSGRHDAAFYARMWDSLRERGAWQGEIWNRRKNGEVYPEWLTITVVTGAAGEVTNYVSTLTDITQRKAADDEIKHLAFYDALTRLPNRRLLIDRLQQALASSASSGREGALMFIDLDNFKTLNDTLGHDAGDLLLQQVAQRLSTCVREVDTVARFGGDEFVVMLEDLSTNLPEAASHVESVGKKILAALNKPYTIAGNEVQNTPSIGATLFDDHKNTADELLKRADLAMYEAKAAGRNTLRFFDPEMQAAVESRAALEADLRQGLDRNEFVPYYQPQVDQRGLVTGAEALLRWRHPRRGLVLPADFIPFAEEIGLILPLGHSVLKAACCQLVAWAAHPQTASLTMAVNVSAQQFRQSEFVEQVMAVIDQTGADPRKLKLELTESLLVDNIQEVADKMFALKATGVSFSLDDFGTGYSSLAYLKRLPLDQLKIDKSFVRDLLTNPNDAAIVRTIVTLALSMGLEVIAEGVEMEQQRMFLIHENCHAFQGFLFGQPVPLAEFEAMLSAQPHKMRYGGVAWT
jgi:diguanylate cyclase (GGDEF)-like protein/PAS domain S-box-containing protein